MELTSAGSHLENGTFCVLPINCQAQGGNNPIQERWDRIPAQGSPGGSYGWEDLSPTGKLYNQPPFAYRLPVMQSIVSDQLGVVCAMLL
uniref:Uncharacterized protein n=1 Tax=Oryza sativa subsp. japonica TaxID=39947 RepID=Q654X3_ORYSJ|nr:hypothetical protein [Oryza sativa Japonica Group]